MIHEHMWYSLKTNLLVILITEVKLMTTSLDKFIKKNYAILINHESFFQRKYFPQIHRFWFLKINSFMAETIKKHFPKQNFYKQIVEFDNNLFIFENWKWLSCRESFSWKSDL